MDDRRQWVRRHPWATGLWIVFALAIVLILAFPGGDASRVDGIIGWLIIATPAALITWGGTAWIDRRAKRRTAVATTPAPVASPTEDVPGDLSAFEETTHHQLPGTAAAAGFRPVALSDLLAMTPTEFEQLCVRALVRLGYDDVRRTGGAGDLAADIVAQDVQGRSCVVQCKRYAPGSGVGSPVVQTFIGMKAVHHKADRGIIMTTAEFTKPAITLAKQHDIVLIDGDDIVKILNLMGAR
ncbi:MAG: restriction endonuclease [Thermomicrobiales bacterium]